MFIKLTWLQPEQAEKRLHEAQGGLQVFSAQALGAQRLDHKLRHAPAPRCTAVLLTPQAIGIQQVGHHLAHAQVQGQGRDLRHQNDIQNVDVQGQKERNGRAWEILDMKRTEAVQSEGNATDFLSSLTTAWFREKNRFNTSSTLTAESPLKRAFLVGPFSSIHFCDDFFQTTRRLFPLPENVLLRFPQHAHGEQNSNIPSKRHPLHPLTCEPCEAVRLPTP